LHTQHPNTTVSILSGKEIEFKKTKEGRGKRRKGKVGVS